MSLQGWKKHLAKLKISEEQLRAQGQIWPPADPKVYVLYSPPMMQPSSSELDGWVKRPKEYKDYEKSKFQARLDDYSRLGDVQRERVAYFRSRGSDSTILDPLSNRVFVSVNSDHVPSFFNLKKDGPKKIKHITGIRAFDGAADYYIASKDWREAIERVEPGVHQFFAVEFRCESGRIIRDYSFFHCLTQVSALDRESSGYRRDVGADGATVVWYPPTSTSGPIKPVVDAGPIAGLHFWNEERLSLNCVSKQMAEALEPLLPSGIVMWPVGLTPNT
ncbi:MAG: DUF1629 domain-containing protein [Hyphomicrobiaceae bacterium]